VAEGRPAYEMTAEMGFVEAFRNTIHGPAAFGDTYENLVGALFDAERAGDRLSEFLLRLGVTDVTALLFLMRTVSMATTVEVLRWASDETVPLKHLHGMATIAHPAVLALHEDEPLT
jgi:hypothetical protein